MKDLKAKAVAQAAAFFLVPLATQSRMGPSGERMGLAALPFASPSGRN